MPLKVWGWNCEREQNSDAPDLVRYWDEGSVSEVPEQVKVVLSDGRHAIYHINVEQPKPNTLTPSEMARIMKDHIFGGIKNGR